MNFRRGGAEARRKGAKGYPLNKQPITGFIATSGFIGPDESAAGPARIPLESRDYAVIAGPGCTGPASRPLSPPGFTAGREYAINAVIGRQKK